MNIVFLLLIFSNFYRIVLCMFDKYKGFTPIFKGMFFTFFESTLFIKIMISF